jgi:photosystem II stability/assembly factor-like uncharacterized protein
VKKALLLCIELGMLLWAADSWTGTMGPNSWWVRDNEWGQRNHIYHGICVVSDSIVWVVGENGQVWKRTNGLHSHQWTQVSITGASAYHLNGVCFVGSTGWIVGEKNADPNKYRGIVYKTTDGGTNWDSIIPLPSPPNLPTPFLEAQMVDVSEGYISCGNGMVLKTNDAGASWSRTTTDPWSDINNISVWYGGLHVIDSTNLWVSGDAYGVVSKSTNGGATWTAYLPDEFKQSYTFPQGTQTPHDPRLANFDAHFSNMNNGVVALSYGKIGKTTNGGTSWDTVRYEPQPTWFYDVAKIQSDTCLSVGNYGVVHRFNGNDLKESVSNEWYRDTFIVDFYTVDKKGTSTVGYAAGKKVAGYYNIGQRYMPAHYILDNIWITEGPSGGDYHYYLHIRWYTTFEQNTREWTFQQDLRTYLLDHTFSSSVDAIDTQGYSDTTVYYTYVDTLAASAAGGGNWKTDYYYSIYLRTNDPCSPAAYYQKPCFVVKFDEENFDSLNPIISVPDPPSGLTAQDVPDDEGNQIQLIWWSVEDAWSYHIGRATDSLGPYRYVKAVLAPCTSYVDSTVQNGITYYYVVLTRWWGSLYSDYSSSASAQAIDNTDPPKPTALIGSYLQTPDLIQLQWQPPSNTPDVAGYWVCPIPPDESDASLNHAAPIDRTIFYLPVDSAWQGPCEFFVAAMDYSGNISDWSDPCTVYVVTTIDTSSSDKATAYNGGRNMARTGSDFWVCYESNGLICVKKSTDTGETWSSRMQLGTGYCATISIQGLAGQQQPPCVVWWAQGTNDTLYFSKYVSGTNWSSPTALITSSNDFGPPSFVIGSDDYCYCAYQDGSSIKYIRFDIDNPQPGTPDSVGQGTDPSIHYMMPGLGYPEVHVAWDKDDSLYYRAKKLSTGWNASEKVLATGQHPSLEVVGSEVHIVSEGAGTDIWHSTTTYTQFGHLWSSAKLYDTNEPSKYPVITGGSACAWIEDNDRNQELYYSYYDAKDGWTTPENISETASHSNYPHIVHKQTQDETRVYFVWTENNSSPYNILFRWDAFDDGSKDDGTKDLPYYVATCGEEQPSGFNLKRDGYLQYGKEAWQRIDYDDDYLEYRFEKLNPERDYALGAYFYHQYNEPISLTAQVDNTQVTAVNLNAHELISRKKMLPAAMTADGVITVKIFGDDPVSAILALYEYEPETGKAVGGPQSYDTPQRPGQLLLQMPNPITKQTLISYELPMETDAMLKVYDITGALRREIQLPKTRTGSILWDGTDNHGRFLATGVYFCRLEAGGTHFTEKVIFFR